MDRIGVNRTTRLTVLRGDRGNLRARVIFVFSLKGIDQRLDSEFSFLQLTQRNVKKKNHLKILDTFFRFLRRSMYIYFMRKTIFLILNIKIINTKYPNKKSFALSPRNSGIRENPLVTASSSVKLHVLTQAMAKLLWTSNVFKNFLP